MLSRRRLLGITLAGSLAVVGSRLLHAQSQPFRLFFPLVGAPERPDPYPLPTPEATPVPTPTPELDAPLLGPPSGEAWQAVEYLATRSNQYTRFDIESVIVPAYVEIGNTVGIDWFLALAQCVHETGGLTSWWCARPRRNPAGLGVTGKTDPAPVDAPPGPHWFYDEQISAWREGISFSGWREQSVGAHLGRLLAYALTDAQANQQQRDLIDFALGFRPLPGQLRGSAPLISGLNGRWAYPGTTYGQSIVDLRNRMRG